MYYKPLKKKQIDVVVSRASSYSLLASLLLSLNLKIKNHDLQGSQQYQYQRLPELFWESNPSRKKEATACIAAPYGRTTRQVSRWIITPIYGVTTDW